MHVGINRQEPWYVFDLVEDITQPITGRQHPQDLSPEPACIFACVIYDLADNTLMPRLAHADLPDPLLPLKGTFGTGLPNGLWRVRLQRTRRELEGEALLILIEAGDAERITVPTF